MKKVLFLIFCLIFTSITYSQFVGSKNSNKYHTADCQWAKKIKQANLITFKSISEATNKGYVPCRVCSPTKDSDPKQSTNPPSQVKQGKASTLKGDNRCQAITKKGTRCTRKAKAGSVYCWQHQK